MNKLEAHFFYVLMCHKHNNKRNKHLFFLCLCDSILLGIMLMQNLVLMHLLMPTENQPLLKRYGRHCVK